MPDPAEVAASPAEPAVAEAETDSLAHLLGLDAATGRALSGAGFGTLEAVRAATDDELRAVGLDEETLLRVRQAAAAGTSPAEAAPPEETSAIVEKWIRSARKPDRSRKRSAPPPAAKASTEVLRKWVDGDDRALEHWIQTPTGESADGAGTSPPPSAPALGSEPPVAATDAPGAGVLPADLVEREETVVRWLTGLLDRVKSDQFDPSSLIREFQELHRGLYDERDRRRRLEEELEHVKRGSIAVIKYVRNRETKAREELVEEKDREIAELRSQIAALALAGVELPAAEQRPEDGVKLRNELADRTTEFAEREAELKHRIVELEGELRGLKSEADRAAGNPGTPEALRGEREDRERELTRRENELRTRFEEYKVRVDEFERKREAINFKDRELLDREQDILIRQKALELEARRVEEAKKGLPAELLAKNPAAQAEATRLEAIEEAIARREQELAAREAHLASRLDEVDKLQKQAVEQEADQLRLDALVETKITKIRTGVRRLDDLTFGGIPAGSQILVSGPAHSGKDLLSRLFIQEGLKSGQGALWVLTDRTYQTVREEITAVFPAYAEHEKKGRVRYVDLYSRSLGVTEAERGVKLLASQDKAILEQLTQAVNTFANELKEKASGYRLVFESVSTLSAYLDTAATFRFLQPLIGRRKLDRAAGYYELETGMHSESDLQTLEHMMDGSINLKVDQLKTFLSLRGITDVQSRAWVGYTFTVKSFNLGSFSLDHIR